MYCEIFVNVCLDSSYSICVQLICHTEILELGQHNWVVSVQWVELVKNCSIAGWSKRLFSLKFVDWLWGSVNPHIQWVSEILYVCKGAGV